MTKREFLDRLAYELGNMDAEAKAEIISDFSEHFDAAFKAGKTEQEISQFLGEPREIAADFIRQYAGEAPRGEKHKGEKHRWTEEDFESFEPGINDVISNVGAVVNDVLDNLQNTMENVPVVKNALGAAQRALENIPFLQSRGWKSRERGVEIHKDKDAAFNSTTMCAGISKILVELTNSDFELKGASFGQGNDPGVIHIDVDERESRGFATKIMSDGLFVLMEKAGGSSSVRMTIPADFEGEVMVKSRSGDVFVSNLTALKNLSVNVVAGDLEVSRIKGGIVAIKSASGNVEAIDIEAAHDITISTASGDVSLGSCVGPEGIAISTGSGDIESTGGRGTVVVSSGSGDICVENHIGHVSTARTGSGDIEISTDTIEEDVVYSSGSGEIAIACNRLNANIRISTASGDASFQTRELFGDVAMKTVSGDIDVGIASDENVTFDMKAASRGSEISNQFWGSGGGTVNLSGNQFPGTRTVKCETHSGDIEIRRIK